MSRRVMSDWEWEEWAERGERIERIIWRLFLAVTLAGIILANAFCLWLIAGSLRECADAAGEFLSRVNVCAVEALESR